MAIGPVNTPPVSQPPGPSTPASQPTAPGAADVSKLKQGLSAPTDKEDASKLSEDDLKAEIKALNEKASRMPGLDAAERQRLTMLDSELSTRSGQSHAPSQS